MHKSIRTRLWVGTVVFVATLAFFYPFLNPPQRPVQEGEDAAITNIDVPDFTRFTRVVDKKQAFFEFLKPQIAHQNQLIMMQRSAVLIIEDRWRTGNSEQGISQDQFNQLQAICQEYAVKCDKLNDNTFRKLLLKVDIIPYELVLVQAANESAWGTSRFAKEGYNFFGLWCFRKGCGFVPRHRNEGSDHEVARFTNLQAGVKAYLNNLNRHNAYSELRNIRASLRDTHQPVTAEALIEGLLSYSERGQAYIDELQAMVRVNRKYM